MKTLVVTMDALPAIVAQLTPEVAGALVFSPDPSDPTKGALEYPDQHQGALQAAIQPAAMAGAAKAELSRYARAKSYDVRVGGTTIDGASIKTDPDSLTLLAGMRALAEAEPDRIFNFDTGSAVASFNAEAAMSLAGAVGAWVQSTFDKRAEVLAAIEAGTVTTTAQVDQAFAL